MLRISFTNLTQNLISPFFYLSNKTYYTTHQTLLPYFDFNFLLNKLIRLIKPVTLLFTKVKRI